VTTANPVASTAFGYDAAGRLNLIHHLGLAYGSTFEESHSYEYDDANRLTSDTNAIDRVMAEYGYDARRQLTSADYDCSPTGSRNGAERSFVLTTYS